MKLKSSIMGLALAGAVALCSNAPAQAQQRPIEPYYFTPKLLYSYTMMDSFAAKGRVNDGGEFWHHRNNGTGWYKGGDKHDKTFGGGASVGYDFGAYSEYPVRLELEYLHRGNVNSSYPGKMTSTINWDGTMEPRYNTPNPISDSQDTNIALASYDVKTTVQTVMLNAFLDFPTETAFTPYVGAGVGGAYVDSKVSGRQNMTIGGDNGYYIERPESYDGVIGYTYRYDMRPSGQQNNWNFAWQVSAGCSYQFTDNLAFDLSYRYSDFGNVEFGSRTFILGGEVNNGDYDPSTDPITPGTNTEKEVGQFTNKGKYDMSAHEVIFGLRITAF